MLKIFEIEVILPDTEWYSKGTVKWKQSTKMLNGNYLYWDCRQIKGLFLLISMKYEVKSLKYPQKEQVEELYLLK